MNFETETSQYLMLNYTMYENSTFSVNQNLVKHCEYYYFMHYRYYYFQIDSIVIMRADVKLMENYENRHKES